MGIAIAAGSVFQFICIVIGRMFLKTGINIVLVVIGVVLGALVGYLCNILFFAVDSEEQSMYSTKMTNTIIM